MRKIKVSASHEYEVIIGRGLLSKVGDIISNIGLKGKLLIVSDENVEPLYSEEVADSLVYAGFDVTECVIPSGEENKNLANYAIILSHLAKNGFTRTDTVLALGGGVIGDMAGFAASTYMRGINFVQMPTTLLAAIDSSVGGKTAVDLPEGKNLVGAFYQPNVVLYDLDTIKTLPRSEILNGLGEGVKYAVLDGGRIYDILNDGINGENLEEFTSLCVESKKRIVEADEKEAGKRKFLNLGHTLAHALEISTNFAVPHGLAVAFGVMEMAKLAYERGEMDKNEVDKVSALMDKCGFNLAIGKVEELLPLFKADKKLAGDELTLVTIEKVGRCVLTKVRLSDITKYFGVE